MTSLHEHLATLTPEDKEVFNAARQAMLAYLRYFDDRDLDIDPHLLTAAALRCYFDGRVPIETYERYLADELGVEQRENV